MTLKYCTKCHKTFRKQQGPETQEICKLCNSILCYFGREDHQLSPKEVLENYDENHPYNPFVIYNIVVLIYFFINKIKVYSAVKSLVHGKD
mgnify:CR=1 FL=1